ncbi:hypothetical protein [Neisseria wadsworthii]|uniref:hypothetical protein n=1 Tax=Neisseria wadsworthii TaxID=607711 RepID=UPI000D326839|nr:hypothetical protein [Neisseria wadsworthii]
MENILLVIIILSVFHFIYEGIVTPTLRVYQRNKLFVLRDKLREIDYQKLRGNDKYAYEYIERGLNNIIFNLSKLNSYSFHKYIEKVEKDLELQKEIAARSEKIKQASIQDLKEIYEEAGKITYDTVCINSGAWFIYLIPIVLSILFFSKGLRLAKALFVTPNCQTEEIIVNVC